MLFVLSGIFVEPPTEGPCNYRGLTYQSGDRFPDEDVCNMCTCTRHGIACTEMACMQG